MPVMSIFHVCLRQLGPLTLHVIDPHWSGSVLVTQQLGRQQGHRLIALHRKTNSPNMNTFFTYCIYCICDLLMDKHCLYVHHRCAPNIQVLLEENSFDDKKNYCNFHCVRLNFLA